MKIVSRLMLGSDASRIIETELKQSLTEVETLREFSSQTDFA